MWLINHATFQKMIYSSYNFLASLLWPTDLLVSVLTSVLLILVNVAVGAGGQHQHHNHHQHHQQSATVRHAPTPTTERMSDLPWITVGFARVLLTKIKKAGKPLFYAGKTTFMYIFLWECWTLFEKLGICKVYLYKKGIHCFIWFVQSLLTLKEQCLR